MKRILLAACAVLALSAAADARDKVPPMPDHIVGAWCGTVQSSYDRHACSNLKQYSLVIKRTRFEGSGLGDCIPESVEDVSDKGVRAKVWLIKARCVMPLGCEGETETSHHSLYFVLDMTDTLSINDEDAGS